MLINDDSKGTSDGKERNQLQAMIAVGSEFMTYKDDESTIQKSGEFVRIDMESESETRVRFMLMHETSDVYDENGNVLDDPGFYALARDQKTHPRTRLFLSRADTDTGRDTAFTPLRSALDMVRMPRYTQGTYGSFPRQLWGINERNYTSLSGKRRLFPQADGKVLVVRDVVERGGRFYYGGQFGSSSRARGTRVSRVEVVTLDPDNGRVSAPIFSFPVHSGLTEDVTGKILSTSARPSGSLPVADATYVYAVAAGCFWGVDLRSSTSNLVPIGGDAGDTYAVCEPAIAKESSDGKTYRSIIAVYAGDDDVRNGQTSGPYRLTCKRTLPNGDTATSKITFQNLPAYPNHYLAARGITLVRTGPKTVMLRVLVHVMQSNVPGSLDATVGDVLYFWTQDNGASWTYQPVIAGFPGDQNYGSLLVRDESTVLVFSAMPTLPIQPVTVWAITPSGFSQIGSIPLATFGQGISNTSSIGGRIPYLSFGFGGVVYRKTAEGVKKRLWMQFDPLWVSEEGKPWVLDHPGSRPMLMTSDDGGVTWARRFLPTKWGFLAGFVVSLDGNTLAVPVYTARKEPNQPVRVAVYVSKNGGESWASTGAAVTLPGETRIDANIVFGRVIGSGQYERLDEDISDCWLEYNRGELHPLLVLRDTQGNIVRSNAARPWMVDETLTEPDHG